MNWEHSIKNSGVARVTMARQTLPTGFRSLGSQIIRQQARARASLSITERSLVGRPVSSLGARGDFSQILTAATRRRDPLSNVTLASLQPARQHRSTFTEATDNATSWLSPTPVDPGSNYVDATGAIPFADLITSSAKKYGVSPDLVAAVVKAESGFNPRARSTAGAKGLMQLMDATARSLGVANVFDPAQNLDGGVRFLSSLLKRYSGNTKLALAAYNAGPGAVDKYGGIPPYKETRDYLSGVLNYWQQFSVSLGPQVLA